MAEDNNDFLREKLEQLLENEGIEHNHYIEPVPKQFAHLPRDVRVWLLTLRDEDIDDLKSAMEMSRSLRRVGRMSKIIIFALPIIATSIVTFIDNIHHIAGWFKGAVK